MATYQGTHAGGTIGQAMAKHKFQQEASNKSSHNHGEDGGKNSNLGGENHGGVLGHLKKAAEHLQHATEMHTKGTLSETQQADSRHVDEEEENSMGEPGGNGLSYSGS
jgi:hypothetical protein